MLPPSQNLRQQANALTERLPPLLMEARRLANTVAQGVHGRHRAGSGETFWQYRRFQTGDTAQAVDWRRSARSEHHYIRETEYEAAESIWIWCDRSASMHYKSRSVSCTKQERALVLALALANLLTRGGERVAAVGSGLPPATGRTGLRRLEYHLLGENSTPAQEESVPPLAAPPPHAITILISDFLAPAETIVAALDGYASHNGQGHLIQVLDPSEITLPFRGRTEFHGLESDIPFLTGRAEALQGPYRQKLRAHQEQLALASRRPGWSFSTHQTDKPAQSPLLGLYAMLAKNDSNLVITPQRERQE